MRHTPPHVSSPPPPKPRSLRLTAVLSLILGLAGLALYFARVGMPLTPNEAMSPREMMVLLEVTSHFDRNIDLLPAATFRFHGGRSAYTSQHPQSLAILTSLDERGSYPYEVVARGARQYLARLAIIPSEAALIDRGTVSVEVCLSRTTGEIVGCADLPSPLNLAVTQVVAIVLGSQPSASPRP